MDIFGKLKWLTQMTVRYGKFTSVDDIELNRRLKSSLYLIIVSEYLIFVSE